LHTLPSPSPQVHINPSRGPHGLRPLDFRVIQCLVELFGGISFGLTTVFQSDIKVCQYYYVENDPQAWQASMHCIIML
jgi:hypothetical protein